MKGLSFRSMSAPRIPRFAAALAVFASSLVPAHAQLTDPVDITQFWFDWMLSPAASGPRFILSTEREILQTGPTSAAFQRGKTELVVADGAVGRVWRDQIIPFFEEWDTDQDGWRDIVELTANPPSDPLDPFSVPTNIEPDVFWLQLADGTEIPVNLSGSNPSSLVRPFSSPNIKLSAGPAASQFPRPLSFYDYSTQFFITNTSSPSPQLYSLSLYGYDQQYPNPSDVGAMEKDLVPGAYQVSFPTLNNPYQIAGLSSAHSMVPNGAFTIGVKKPTWLLRFVETFENINEAPVPQKWVNGRLRLDPNIASLYRWDDIVRAGLASPAGDRMALWIEDDNNNLIWPPIGGSAELSVGNPQATLTFPGLLPAISPGNPAPPIPITGFLVFRYTRNNLSSNAGDVATVFLRVPVEFVRGYASWRISMFPGAPGSDDSISGPNADPDGDGLTNQQEYEAGSDPTKPTVGLVNAFSQDIDSDSATLGATVETDPFSTVNFSIFERGIIYAPSATNPFPLLDGPGVTRISSPPAVAGDFTVNAQGLSGSTRYSYRGYVITSIGTFYNPTVSTFTTSSVQVVTLPTVTSPFTSGQTLNSINLGGTVTDDGGSAILETGVVYSVTATNDNPFVDGPGVIRVPGGSTSLGTFSVNVGNLAPSTSYSFRAYVITNVGISHTATIGSFATATGPTIISPTVTNVGSSTATLGGNVTGSGGLAILQRGVVFSSTTNNPLIGAPGVTSFAAASSGLGVFTVNVSGLLPNTVYFYKAYAINSVGTAYTVVGNFSTTGALPTLGSPTISEVTSISARIGATVTSDGQSTILERGFVYAQSSVNGNPVIGGPGVTKLVSPGTTGQYSTLLFNLTENTGYTFKAYARNAVGTSYSTPYGFFTTLPPLTVTDPTVSDITSTTATVGGTVVSDEGNTVDERGVVLNTDPLTPPEIGGPGVIQVTGTGSMGPFTVPVAGLNPNTQYFFRAYATNISGTSYSDISGFTTQPLVLLGLSEVGWLSQAQPLGDGSDGEEPQTESEPSAPVPQFVYEKSDLDSDGMVYSVEVSSDSMNWVPAGSDWSVVETGETITATWDSTETAPTRLFFRVKGNIPNP